MALLGIDILMSLIRFDSWLLRKAIVEEKKAVGLGRVLGRVAIAEYSLTSALVLARRHGHAVLRAD